MVKKQKGFTLVELVIVIAVVAILAVVLIPTFASLIKRANISADQQTVTNMNTVLSTDEAMNGRPDDLVGGVYNVLLDAGFRMPLKPTSSGHEFYWIPADNRIVLVEMKGDAPSKITYPEQFVTKYSALPAVWYSLSGENKVSSASELSAALAQGGIVTLTRNIDLGSSSLSISGEEGVTINLNGNTLSSSNKNALVVNANVTVA